MRRVITYGTFDLLHHGHISLLKRAKALGDYLIVGVTAEDFDRQRGKINVENSLDERIEAIRATGLADCIIVEEYEGQKIDDIRKYEVDVFTVGTDWEGHFDYLKEYCEVVYLERTRGVSSSGIREEKSALRIGMVGYSSFLNKFYRESNYVNAVKVVGLCTGDSTKIQEACEKLEIVTDSYEKLLEHVDAIYLHSNPGQHYIQAREALLAGKHVLCESPIALSKEECRELYEIAEAQNCILMEAIRTAYTTAYARLLSFLKAGKIGEVVSVDATCTSLRTHGNFSENSEKWGAVEAWGPTALLPVFQILGTNYLRKSAFCVDGVEKEDKDIFTKLNFDYEHATATIKVGTGVKSEGELVVTGTKGYAYVPAPWWKMDYFELRYEEQTDNKRFFYQVEGEGIRYELVAFAAAVRTGKADFYIGKDVTYAIADMIGSTVKG